MRALYEYEYDCCLREMCWTYTLYCTSSKIYILTYIATNIAMCVRSVHLFFSVWDAKYIKLALVPALRAGPSRQNNNHNAISMQSTCISHCVSLSVLVCARKTTKLRICNCITMYLPYICARIIDNNKSRQFVSLYTTCVCTIHYHICMSTAV